METLIIEESKWLHGDKWKSLLLSSDGKMCCLGFLAKANGADDNDILGKGTPENTKNVKWHPALSKEVSGCYFDSGLCKRIIVLNDKDETTDCEFNPELFLKKKQELIELFKTMDINLEFVP